MFSRPRELTASDISAIIEEFRSAAQRALEAGFNSVELHAANGYLPEQFLLDGSNFREDDWGGNIAHRARFLLDTVAALTEVWGAGRVAVRISPSGIYGDMQDSDPATTRSLLPATICARFSMASSLRQVVSNQILSKRCWTQATRT